MFGFIGNIGPWELVFILLIALIVVGPGKLPEVAKSIGKATREFKKATTGVKKELDNAMKFEDDSFTTIKAKKTEEESGDTKKDASLDELNKMVSSPRNEKGDDSKEV